MNIEIKRLDKNYNSFHTFKLFKDYKDSVLLESVNEDKNLSKYSFIGLNPIWTFKSKGKLSYINDILVDSNNPFDALESQLNKYKIKYDFEIPFIGGAIGYFSYDVGRITEEFKDTANEEFNIPDSIFNFYNNIIIFDIINKKTYISDLGLLKENHICNIESAFNEYKEEEAEFKELDTKFYSNFEKDEYIDTILKLKEYIRSGDVYIANLTRNIWCHNNENPFEIYQKLRGINRAPFSAFINYKDFQIISSSPERFLQVVDNTVNTRPIKGTRPRGKTMEEDLKNKEELIKSEKDKAELLMIVDLERNDLSKVCRPNSVKVTELFKLEEYPTVFHLVSNIYGELEEEISSVSCMKQCFPGGSITGAPKIRAIEIIEELEGLKRNIYTGSIGYFDIRGNCDFNIVIRSIIKIEDKAYFGVGGGITWDSNPEAEWFETLDKANALMRVL